MKNFMLLYIVTTICTVFSSADAFCQTQIAFAKTNIDISAAITEENEVLPPVISREEMKSINIKVVREFIKKFGDKENVTWHKKLNGGYVAEFLSDSVRTMAWYKKNGTCAIVLRRYNENKMSTELRTLIKRNFFDYAITEVVEIIMHYEEDNIIYRTMIKNQESFKILKICYGEIEVIGDYIKP